MGITKDELYRIQRMYRMGFVSTILGSELDDVKEKDGNKKIQN